MSHGNEFAPCNTCVFLSHDANGGWFESCNLDDNNDTYERRQNTKYGDILPLCYDHRTYEEMLEILEQDDGIIRT